MKRALAAQACRTPSQLLNATQRAPSDTFDGLPRATWLTQRPHLPSLHLRCYWGYLARPPLFANMHRKTLVLLRELGALLAHKRYFLKIDTDTVIVPTRPTCAHTLGFAHVHAYVCMCTHIHSECNTRCSCEAGVACARARVRVVTVGVARVCNALCTPARARDSGRRHAAPSDC